MRSCAKSGIYLVKNIVNGKIYVGSTNDLVARKSSHFCLLARQKHRNPHLQSAFNKYGKNSFDYYIIEYCSVDKLLEREDFYIGYFQSNNRHYGYNIEKAVRATMSEETKKKISIAKKGKEGHSQTKETRCKISIGLRGCQNRLGHKNSEESKRKLSKTFKEMPIEKKKEISKKKSASLKALGLSGKKHHFYGKHHSKETRKKMSIAGKGRIFTPLHLKRLSEWQKGKTLSVSHRKNLSEAQTKRWAKYRESRIKEAV